MKTASRLLIALALAAIVVVATLVIPPSDPADAGMGWSAITGVIDTGVPADQLVVSFKVVDKLTGDVVWQTSSEEVVTTQVKGQVHYGAIVDGSVRPDDPSYEWVMWVYAVRAEGPVYVNGFTLNDQADNDHHGALPGYDVQGRMVEVPLSIQ